MFNPTNPYHCWVTLTLTQPTTGFAILYWFLLVSIVHILNQNSCVARALVNTVIRGGRDTRIEFGCASRPYARNPLSLSHRQSEQACLSKKLSTNNYVFVVLPL